jgi:hypothetical protein
MPKYNCMIILMDEGIEYKNLEEAKKETEKWAQTIAEEEQCGVVEVEVEEVG